MNGPRLLIYALTALLLTVIADLLEKIPLLSKKYRNYSIEIDV